MTRVRRIVLTRTRDRCLPWQHRLEAAGIDVLVLPMIRHRRLLLLKGVFDKPYDWILFTSPRGVREFFERPQSAGLVGRMPRLGALGKGTAFELECRGLRDTLHAEARNGREMARYFVNNISVPSRILLPGAADRTFEPVKILCDAGHQAETLALYRTEAVEKNEVPRSPFLTGDLIFFTSPSAVRAFHTVYDHVSLPCAAIGETTAKAAQEVGFEPYVAERPDLESLCAAAGINGLNRKSSEPGPIKTDGTGRFSIETRNGRAR